MRLLVTGVTGFIGGHLARHLTDAGHEVWGTTQAGQCAVAGVHCLEADLCDPDSVHRAVAQSDPEAVIHLAGLSHVGRSWSALADYFAVNVAGARTLLEACAGRRVLVASSAEVYGVVPDDDQPIAEDRPAAPQSPYAMTKAAMELLAAAAGAVVVRAFNVVGPGQAPSFALPSFSRQLAAIRAGRQSPVLKVGNLAARRDFLHVRDAAEAYAVVLERGAEGEVYNLGSGQAVSIEEALHRLIVISGVRARTEVDPERVRPVDVPLLRADVSRLRGLGWEPRRGLDAALEDLWRSVLEEDAAAARS